LARLPTAIRLSSAAAPPRNLIMLHGIYGRGRNWQGVAKAVTAARPEYGCWLVDLPHHGDSGPGTHGDTVAGLASDLTDWLSVEGITADAILGHSYGGKVALAMAAAMPTATLQVWVIDSTPEVKPPSGSAWTMLEVVRQLPREFTSRAELVAALTKAGYSQAVALWMSTNLEREGASFRWRVDFDAMERLMRDFFTTDLWAVVESPSPTHDIHFLKASESSAISPEAVARIAAAPHDRVHLHQRPGGHWIHAESPDVVISLLTELLP
jgi:pimeloyl-ACP methyl ester carboxylesterase